MHHPRTDTRFTGALARRGFKSDRGIADTLRPQSDRGSYDPGNYGWQHHPKPQTTCHCERHIVPTTWQRIYDGAGETCGAPNCKPKENP